MIPIVPDRTRGRSLSRRRDGSALDAPGQVTMHVNGETTTIQPEFEGQQVEGVLQPLKH